MRPRNLVQLDSHATSTLRYIRASMDAAVSISVPGSAGYAMGAVGALTAALASHPQLHRYWLALWLSAAVIAGTAGGLLIAQPASLRGLSLSGTPARKFVLCLCPPLFAGAIMTGVLWSSANMHAIPGTWLLLYGSALIATSVSTTRHVATMGGLFMLLGLIALLLPGEWHMLMLGAGFGGLHLLFGYLIGRHARDRQD